MAQLRRFLMAIGGVDLQEIERDGELNEREDLTPGHIVEATTNAIDRFEDLERENRRLREVVDSLQDIGQEKTTKEQKVAAIVVWAKRQAQDETGDRVVVKVRDIVGATGVSRRYAYDLIDDLPQEYEWILDRHDVTQYGDLELDKDGMERALVVDLERLHSEPEAVNKFTTPASGIGVAD